MLALASSRTQNQYAEHDRPVAFHARAYFDHIEFMTGLFTPPAIGGNLIAVPCAALIPGRYYCGFGTPPVGFELLPHETHRPCAARRRRKDGPN
jgi:hypothetical protein